MQKLHAWLLENSTFYASWHKHKVHAVAHFWILSAIGVIFTGAIISSVNQNLALESAWAGMTKIVSTKSATAAAPDLTEFNNNLLTALKQYQTSTDANRQDNLNVLIDAAQSRRSVMLEQANKNPKNFLLASLPAGLAKKFPAEVVQLLESEKEISGKLTIRYVDYKDSNKEDVRYLVDDKTSGKKYSVFAAQGEIKSFNTGDYVQASGVALDNNLVVSEAADLSQKTVSSQITSGPTGDQHVLAIPINFTNSSNQPWTTSQIYSQLFTDSKSVNNYYKESSFNKTYFDGDVTSWVTVPYDNSNCDSMVDTWASAAKSAAVAMGYSLSSYNHYLYVMSGASGCSWAGLSDLGGNPSETWTNNYNTATLYDHELGHAIGMWHASSYSCGSKAIDVASNCTLSEYGDYYDTMGYWNSYHNDAPHKAQETWIGSSNIQTITVGGIYTIYPLETSSGNVQILKIYKPDTNEYYYLEYRQATGFDSGLPSALAGGVGIHVWSSGRTKLLDTTPGDSSWNNAFLADGRTFQDYVNGISVTQVSHDSVSAKIQVVYGSGVCTVGKPTVSVSPVSQQGAAGQTLKYTVTITNNDTASCAGSSFSASAAGLPAGFVSNSGSVTLNPGASGTIALSITSPSGYLDSSNTFSINISDANDSSHANSLQATYIVFTDTTAPTVAITNPLNGSTLGKSASVTITVTATDNMSVARVEIYIDNKLATTDTTSPYSYKWNVKNLAKGSHTITAKAYDPFGNAGTANITVTK